MYAVPLYGLPNGLLERSGMVTEGPSEVGVVYHKRLLELVEHLDHLTHSGVEEPHSAE